MLSLPKDFHYSQRNLGILFCFILKLSQKVERQPYYGHFPDEEGLDMKKGTMITPLYVTEVRKQPSSTSHPCCPHILRRWYLTIHKERRGFSSVWLYFLCGRKNVSFPRITETKGSSRLYLLHPPASKKDFI